VAEAPAQDADLVVLQLRDQPAHDFWAGSRHIPMPQTREGALGLLNLRADSKAIFNAELDCLHLHLPKEAIDDLASEIGSAPVARLAVEGEWTGWTSNDLVLRQFAPLLLAAIDAPRNPMQAFLDHLILATALHVAEQYGGMRRNVLRRGGLAPWQLRRAQEMLAADLSGQTSLHDVAEVCGLSTSYFSRAFKASTGWAPHSWLQARRIDKARALLLDNRLPLADVALQSGFADQSHFTRVFKSITGQTPGAFRRALASTSSLDLNTSRPRKASATPVSA
jgi:AraC-like DNA-binding protein